MKRLRVYLSSTYQDLRPYREAVSAALRKSGLDVAQMEDYTAADERPLDLCLRDVGQSEIYVGLFAWRYGYVPPADKGNPERRSITELEYRQAERSGLRKLVFFAHQDTRGSWPDSFRDEVTGDGDRGELLRRFRDEVCTEKTASFFRTPEELATLVLAAIMRSGSTGRFYNIPRLSTGFVPRPGLAQSIVNALVGGAGLPTGSNTLIQGPGGFGKTTLAIEACHQPALVEAFPDGMLWTSLGQAPNLVAILSDLHALAADGPPTVAGEDQIGLALAKALQGRRCLLVVDDIWRPDDLTQFLRLDGPRLLVTTRLRALADQTPETDWAEVVVGEMTASEAAAILGRGMALEASDAAPLQQLAARLGCWPLMLELVGARILEEVRRRGRSVAESIAVVGALLERKGVFSFDRPGTKQRNAALALSIDAGLDAAEESSPGLAGKAADLSVFPQNLAIPAAILADLWGIDAADAEEDVLRPLDNLNLLQWIPESGVFRLHAMVSEALAALADKADGIAGVHRRLLDAWGDPHRLPHDYAWRWFGWHCSRAKESTRLRALLLDLSWLEAKLAASGVDALARDFDYCDKDHEITRLQQTVRLSAHIVAADPLQLPAQLLARLPEGDGELRARMLEQARSVEHGWLRPIRASLTPPGGPLLRTLVGHTDPVTGVGLTPDGRRIISASEDFTARIWDLESGAAVRTLKGFARRVTAVAVSPDGAVAVGGLRDGRLVVWRLEDGAVLRTISVPIDSELRAVAITPDGRGIVSAGDKTVTVWNLDDGELRRTLDGDSSGVRAIAITPDGARAVCGGKTTLRIWDLQSGALLQAIEAGYPGERLFQPFHHDVATVALTPDAKRIVLASWNRLVLAQLDPLVPVHEFAGHTSDVTAVAVTPDGARMVSGSMDGTLKVWDLTGGGLLQTLEGHSGAISAIAVTPDGTRAVSVSADQTIKVWNLGGTAAEGRFQGHAAAVTAVAIVPGRMRAITGGEDYAVRIWDVERGDLLRTIDAGPTFEEDFFAPGPVWTMAATADGTRVVSIGQHLTVRVWRVEDGTLVTTFREHFYSRDSIAVTADDRRVVLAGAGVLTAWDLSTGELLATLAGHAGEITAIAAVPGSSQVVSASEDGTLRLWDLDRATELRVFEGHEGTVTSVAVTSDGARFVSGGADATLKVWNVADASVVFTLEGHGYRVTNVAVTPDGSRAVSASWDDMPRAWNIRDGSAVGTFAGHTGRVSALAVSGDGTWAVLATSEGRVAAWNLDGCLRLGAFDADAPIAGVAVGSDARTIIAGDHTGGVHFLRIEEAAVRRD